MIWCLLGGVLGGIFVGAAAYSFGLMVGRERGEAARDVLRNTQAADAARRAPEDLRPPPDLVELLHGPASGRRVLIDPGTYELYMPTGVSGPTTERHEAAPRIARYVRSTTTTREHADYDLPHQIPVFRLDRFEALDEPI